MNIVGDEIVDVLSDGGIWHAEILVVSAALRLKSGRLVELTETGVQDAPDADWRPDTRFERCRGLGIVAVDESDEYPTVVLRLSDGSRLVIGSPAPYLVELQGL